MEKLDKNGGEKKPLALRLTLSDQTGRCRSPHQEWSLLKEKVCRTVC